MSFAGVSARAFRHGSGVRPPARLWLHGVPFHDPGTGAVDVFTQPAIGSRQPAELKGSTTRLPVMPSLSVLQYPALEIVVGASGRASGTSRVHVFEG